MNSAIQGHARVVSLTRRQACPFPTKPQYSAALLALVSLAVPVRGASSVPSNQSIPIKIHQGVPPKALWGTNWTAKRFDIGDISAALTYDTEKKRVNIVWTRGALKATQAISTPYWPTAVIRVNNSTLAIAGKLEQGGTVIERVKFLPPVELLAFPPGQPVLVLSPIGTRRYMYNEATIGRDMVLFMMRVKPSPYVLQVRFWDSGAVYNLDLASQELTPQVTSDPGQGITVPSVLLVNAYRGCWRGRHNVLGDLYVYGADAGSSNPPLVLVDSGLDGIIDDVLLPDDALWSALALGDPASYEDR